MEEKADEPVKEEVKEDKEVFEQLLQKQKSRRTSCTENASPTPNAL